MLCPERDSEIIFPYPMRKGGAVCSVMTWDGMGFREDFLHILCVMMKRGYDPRWGGEERREKRGEEGRLDGGEEKGA